MKKLFISISAAFVFILSCIIPFTASAEFSETLDYVSFTTYKNTFNVTDDKPYFIIQCNDNSGSSYFCWTIGYQFNNSSEYTITENNGIYTLNCSNMGINGFRRVYSVTENGYNHSDWQDTNSNSTSYGYISQFIYDSNNNTITFTATNNMLNDTLEFNSIDSNIDILNPDYMPIEVTVFPELEDNYNYSTDFEGSSFEINQLQVDIKNNTGYVYEYAILIQPKNEPLNVGLPTNSDNNTFFWGSSKVTYALVKDEWIQRDAADALSAAFNALGYNPYVGDVSAPITINTPSAWHIVPPNDYKREWLYYDSMQLKKGVNYTLKVYVYNLTQNVPSSWSDQLVYPAFRDLELVYSKDFSVARDTKFDPELYVDGYSYDNTSSLGSQFDKIKGIVDPEDNTVKILGEKDYNTSSNVRIGSNSSFNSLISNSSSFLSLLRSVLSYMPDWLSVLLFGGLLAFVLAAIWRKI